MKYIAPSFLSADIWRTAEQLTALNEAGCSYLHLDVMDGHFVPNISFGPDWVKKMRPHTDMQFDVHLMVEEPDFLLENVAAAGAQFCTVHVEAVRHLDRTLNRIRDLGMKAGVALNPATSLETIGEVLHLCDLVLVMSVNPGFGGQKFIPYTLNKIRQLKDRREMYGLDFLIEIDGGVCADNAEMIAEAGTDLLVAGNAVMGQPDVAAAYKQLTELANR